MVSVDVTHEHPRMHENRFKRDEDQKRKGVDQDGENKDLDLPHPASARIGSWGALTDL